MPSARGERDLVLEGVAGEDGVVLLDVELDLLLEAVALERSRRSWPTS